MLIFYFFFFPGFFLFGVIFIQLQLISIQLEFSKSLSVLASQ